MTIGFVPIRAGSKSIEFKNIVALAGKPLVYWCLSAVQESYIDKIILYYDDVQLIDSLYQYDFPKIEKIRRSPESAMDEASTEFAMLEYLENYQHPLETIFMLIQATNPWITKNDIDNCLEIEKDVVSVAKTNHFYWEHGKPSYDPLKRPRRQFYAGLMLENGALYKSTVGHVLESGCRFTEPYQLYMMPDYTKLEIDTMADLVQARALCRHYNCNPQELRDAL